MIIAGLTISMPNLIIGLVIGIFVCFLFFYISDKRKIGRSKSKTPDEIIKQIEKTDNLLRATYKVNNTTLKECHNTLNDFYSFFNQLNDKMKGG